jgi:hypothetical protein
MRDLRLYFAYGSNMAPSRILERGINAKFLGVGYLDHYKFMLNKISKKDPSIGFANVVPCWNKRVYGALFDLGNIGKSGLLANDPKVSPLIQENIRILDKAEGYPNHYERTTVGIHIDFEGKLRNMQSFTYMAGLEKQSIGNLFVREEYVSKINEGLDSLKQSTGIYESSITTTEFLEYKRDTKQLMEIWKK